MIDFNVQVFVDCAKELLRADETERALWLLDNLPAYYRDHPIKEITDLKTEVVKRIATPTLYALNDVESSMIDFETGHSMEGSLRGQILINDVKWFNDHGHIPHIFDYGPGEYWLPIILKKHNLNFTYEPIALNRSAFDAIKPLMDTLPKRDDTGPTIFVACEIIEHLWNEQDIKTEMLSHGGLADVIHISTPRYTFDTDCKDWTVKKELGHLRAYTPKEFSNILDRLFPEYEGKYFDSQIMHARLILNPQPVKLDNRWQSVPTI